MATFPFIPFRYNGYYNQFYPHYYKNNGDIRNTNNLNATSQNIEKKGIEKQELNSTDKVKEKRQSKNNSFANINLSALLESNLNTPIIEVLGIKLYLDDLIIISLLFFLYKEGVQDEILFGILILLLLS